MTKRRRDPLIHNANVGLPEHVSSDLISKVLNLPENCRKTAYLKSEILSKFVSKDTEPASVRRQRAINKWLATEANNAATNDRLLLLHEEYNILPRVRWSSFRDKCSEFIISIIGEIPPVEALIGSFSGGASTSRGRTESNPASKYLGKADVTPLAFQYLETIRDEVPGWSESWDLVSFDTVPGNILFTVPKKTDIDRCACKEPDVNMFLQKGVGRFIRHALRLKGVNLNDQSINKELARRGSIGNHLATLDLSSASDSVSYELVAQLLPPHWLVLLDNLRSHVTLIDGVEHHNEMFSSMGNGFTFELESLLFFSLAKTVAFFEGVTGVINVYGDDIIVPACLSDDLSWVLSVVGFEVNTSKSFSDGPFRESCGGHFYNGNDVTPFFIRKPIETLVDLIHFGNSLRKWAGVGSLGILDPDVWPVWAHVKSMVPECFWGGSDLNSKEALVSPDKAHRRLLPKSRKRTTGHGGYIHWLNSTWVREASSDAIETSLLTRVENSFRSKPAAKADVISLSALFLDELGLTTE